MRSTKIFVCLAIIIIMVSIQSVLSKKSDNMSLIANEIQKTKIFQKQNSYETDTSTAPQNRLVNQIVRATEESQLQQKDGTSSILTSTKLEEGENTSEQKGLTYVDVILFWLLAAGAIYLFQYIRQILVENTCLYGSKKKSIKSTYSQQVITEQPQIQIIIIQ
eukprot:403343935